jgi:hypothetical protein
MIVSIYFSENKSKGYSISVNDAVACPARRLSPSQELSFMEVSSRSDIKRQMSSGWRSAFGYSRGFGLGSCPETVPEVIYI